MSAVEDGAPLIRMTEIEGKGRALVASQPLRAGQIVLRDSPILVYSAIPLMMGSLPPQQQKNNIHYYCSNCFRVLQPSGSTVVSCPTCSGEAASLFCSPNCRSIALASSHTTWVCQALNRLRDYHSPLLHQHQDRQLQACFLVAAYNLAAVSLSRFRTLLSLQGECHSAAQPDDAAHFLHSLISSICPPPQSSVGLEFSLELTAALLAKDKLNAFGLMEPFAEDRERAVRAYGIYPKASFFNHDCLPNVCRFDYVDAEPAATEHNTDIVIRVIHDVPQGRELCLSYFPVNLKYYDRQRRLSEDYGFTCECDRCKVEANWSEEEEEKEVEDEDNNEDTEEEMDEDCDEQMADSETENDDVVKGVDDFPHAYFFLRYMCNRKNCWGTLAPLPPTDATPSSVMECNVCGKLKNYEDLMDGDAPGE